MMKFKKYSPLTGELVQEYDYASAADIENALAELQLSFLHWKKVSLAGRQNVLKPLVSQLTKKKELFAKTISEEMGKRYAESIAEVEKCIKTIDFCTQMDLSFLAPEKVQSIYEDSEISHEPLGLIYAIMPWNFPLWQVVRMIVPALLSGNVILLKHSEVSPKMGELIEQLFSEISEKPLLRHRLASHDKTERILSDVRIQGVSLTGSTRAGLIISQLAAKYLKKCVLELGGSDPYIVYPDADLASSAKTIAKSRLQNMGQSCIAAKRCLVNASVMTEFLEKLKAEFQKTEPGYLADVSFKKSLIEQINNLNKNTEAQLIYDKPHGLNESSAAVNQQIFLLKKNSEWIKDQEFFAPVLLVIPFETNEEALQIANSTNYGLGAALFSKNIDFAKRQARQIEAGQIAINDFIKSDVMIPFGGVKMSGLGRELGKNGFFEFTSTKVTSYS